MYTVSLSNQARKFLAKAERQLATRLVSVLQEVRIDPHANAKKMSGSAYWYRRVGNYRVILEIKNLEARVLVVAIGDRKQVYERV